MAGKNLSIHGRDRNTGKLSEKRYNENPQASPISNSPRAVRRRAKSGKK